MGLRAGRIKIKIGPTGAFTASFFFGGKNYSLSGAFDTNGTFTGTIPRASLWPLTVSLNLNMDSFDNPIDGTVSYNASTQTVTFVPSTAGTASFTYSITDTLGGVASVESCIARSAPSSLPCSSSA